MPDAATRFWTKVRKTEACWEWTSAKANGYGVMWLNGKNVYAHRYSFEALRYTIPDGRQLDHLCRNRACVNPDHLEVVTARTNYLRGIGVGAKNAVKTHCKNGHPFADDNLAWDRATRATGASYMRRRCRACKRQSKRDHLRPRPIGFSAASRFP